MEDATDRKLTLNKSSPNEKASEDDLNQVGAAGENESKQQTEGAGRNRLLQCEKNTRKMVYTHLQKQKYRRRRTRN